MIARQGTHTIMKIDYEAQFENKTLAAQSWIICEAGGEECMFYKDSEHTSTPSKP